MSIERYSRATQSKNLAMSDWQTKDVDWLAAAGMSAIHGDPLGPMVARWLTGSKGAVFSVIGALQARYGKHKTLSNDARDDILDAADWWHDHTCQDCGGRGHRQIPDTPMMEEIRCATCGGTGKREHSRSTHAYAWTLRELEAAAAVCAFSISAKVA
jgi:hypothetical protein